MDVQHEMLIHILDDHNYEYLIKKDLICGQFQYSIAVKFRQEDTGVTMFMFNESGSNGTVYYDDKEVDHVNILDIIEAVDSYLDRESLKEAPDFITYLKGV